MRTPPPVLPPDDGDTANAYRPTWLDRAGPDGGLALRAIGYGFLVAAIIVLAVVIIALRGGGINLPTLLITLVAAAGAGALTAYSGTGLGSAAGQLVKRVTLPSGSSTPYEEQYSYQESLAARGDVSGALESYEAVIAERPGALLARRRAAELYAGKGGNPARAAALFREIRDSVEAPPREVLYASTRLVDLYDGVLADPGRAVVELRRIIDRFPESDAARGARAALPGLKARLAARAPD